MNKNETFNILDVNKKIEIIKNQWNKLSDEDHLYYYNKK